MKRDADWEVRTIIDMVRMCQALSVLPQPGGLIDQDAYFVFLLKTVMAADNKKAELEESRRRLKGR